MSKFKTKNGIFVSHGNLETAGLAVAFNIENFLSKVNKTNKDSFQIDATALISKTHTVLAVLDNNADFPARMLNAGGILTFTTVVNGREKALGMLMLKEKNGFQLGFGKVELCDLHFNFNALQDALNIVLRYILSVALRKSANKDEFAAHIKSDALIARFTLLENTLVSYEFSTNSALNEVFEGQEQLSHVLTPAFGRPALNFFAITAAENAAKREIIEELDCEIANGKLTKERLVVHGAINREDATKFVTSLLGDRDTSKFSAKEFNADFESNTFVVTCPVTAEEFAHLTCVNCQVVAPKEVQIRIVNAEKGMLQTSLPGYLPILGGGNQFTVALFCKDWLNLRAKFIAPEVVSVAVSSATVFGGEVKPIGVAGVVEVPKNN